jgi:hypothetical protein
MPQAKPVIFVASANDREPGGKFLRNLPDELREIREALGGGGTSGLWEIVERTNCTIDDILGVFQRAEFRNRIAVLHFAGHAGSYQLLLEKPDGSPGPIDAAGFAAFLSNQLGLQFVFLNGCSTAAQVQGLLDAHIGAVIATSSSIDDEVATRFAGRFYRGLAGGAGVQTAFDEASAEQRMAKGDNRRDVYQEGAAEDRWPWALTFRSGAAEAGGRWSLGEAAGDPLFGVPPLPVRDLPELPYRHLQWFGRQHAEIFFGRGREIRELYERVTSAESPPILLLYGQSGVGKSSLLDAGLLPRLEASHQPRYERRDQGIGLLGTLKRALEVHASGGSVAEGWRALESSGGKPVLLVLDQAEEVFTRPNVNLPNELAELAAALKEMFGDPMSRPKGKLLLSFRKEWLAEIEASLAQATLPRAKVFLSRLDRAGIVEAIVGPSKGERLQKRWGLTVEDGLAESIAEELLGDPESNIGPTLQVLLTKLWFEAIKKSADRPHFDRALYQELKRQGVLLRDFLDQQLKELCERVNRRDTMPDTGLALDILTYHTTPLGTSARRTSAELASAYTHVARLLNGGMIQDFKDLYLLADDSGDGGDSTGATRLTHDTLAPLVRYRFDNSAKLGQLARRIVESRAREWSDGRTGAPLDEGDLGLVEGGATGMRAWTGDERRMIDASRKEKAAAVRKRKMMWVGGIAAVLLIVASAIAAGRYAAVAHRERTKAQEQERAARAGRFAAMSEGEHDDTVALRYGLVALGLDSAFSVTEALRKAMRRNGSEFILPQGGVVYDAEFSPDGKRIVTASSDRTAVVWTLATRDSIHSAKQDGVVLGAEFDPTGELVLIASKARGAQLWNPVTNSMTPLCCHGGDITHAEFSADGHHVVTASFDGTARVWNTAGQEVARLGPHHDRVGFATFSPDGRYVVSTSDDGSVRLSDLVAKTAVSLVGHTDAVTYAAFSPKSDRLVTASKDGTARIWTVAGGPLDTIRFTALVLRHGRVVNSAVFSPDGERVLTASDDKLARTWDVHSGKPGETPVPNHLGYVRYAEYSRDGQAYVTASDDGTSMVRDATNSEAIATLRGHTGAVLHAAFSRDGRWVVTAGEDGTARIFIVGTSELRDSAMAVASRIVR